MIREEEVEAVVDLSLNELVNHLAGGITMPARIEVQPLSRKGYPRYWSLETLISWEQVPSRRPRNVSPEGPTIFIMPRSLPFEQKRRS